MIHLVHPTGNTFVRALLEGLQESKTDFRFWTTIASSTPRLNFLLPKRFHDQLARRCFPVPRKRIGTRPLREWARLLSSSIGIKALTHHESGWASVDAVYRDLDRSVATRLRLSHRGRSSGSWIYGYEDGALECFCAAKQIGMQRAYELPIAYWACSRRLLEEEAERLPEWAATLVGPSDSEAKLERKTQELELADLIVVPSRFVERSLPVWLKPEQRVVVVEFGSPDFGYEEQGKMEVVAEGRGQHSSSKSGVSNIHHSCPPLRVLFAGSMTQRKGLADVFEAMRLLNRRDVELVVMGSPVLPMEFYLKQNVPFTYEATRPHAAVLALMRTCDVLVLPSIVEGRALVQQEALACGLPIIVTANAGGEDLVLEGKTGFVVPIRSPLEIALKVSWLADHRDELESMRPLCRVKAASYTWQRYASTILGPMGMKNVC